MTTNPHNLHNLVLSCNMLHIVQIPPQTWSNPSTAYERTKAAVQTSLQRIGFPSIDLMLLHAPGAPEGRSEAWRALEDAQRQVSLLLS
jgi:diketogulonate reductase-like aldo/keto reductase